MNTEPPIEHGRLARFSIALIVSGFFVFLIGIFPEIVRLNFTAGFGVLQMFTFLLGLGLMTLGGYIYAYATRQRSRPRLLRHEVGIRLIASGYVLCCASTLADIIGIGSHNVGSLQPAFGLWQAFGVLIGVLIIVFGLFLYVMQVER